MKLFKTQILRLLQIHKQMLSWISNSIVDVLGATYRKHKWNTKTVTNT